MTRGDLLRSLWKGCLVITVIGFVVQTIPIIGLLSFLALTPYWPTLFLNAALLLMAADGLVGSRKRWLLIVPLIWFGGYEIAAVISRVEAGRLNRAAATINEHRPAAWDKATQTLQIINGSTDEIWGSDLRLRGLIQDYDLDEAWSRSNWARLSRASCPKPRIVDGIEYSIVSRGGYPTKEPFRIISGVCLLFGQGAPPSGSVVVAAHTIVHFKGLLAGQSQDFDIKIPGQDSFTVRYVAVSALPWLPIPVAGCHFKGGLGDRWDNDCHAYFDHFSWQSKTSTQLKVVARALGLKPASLEQRLPDLSWAAPVR